MTVYAISQLTDLEQVRAFLETDRNYAAYALGDLDPRYVADTTWVAASHTGEVEGLALIYTALEPAVLFLMGEVPALSALLMHGVGPDEVLFTASPDLEDTLRAFYAVDRVEPMHRMRVTAGTFISPEGHDHPPTPPIPLDESHAQAILELQRAGAGADARAWNDVAFTPEMVRDGYYRGILQGDKLIAAAGTHLVARQESVAAIGNVIVHPDQRRKGLGGLVSHAVTKALIDDGFDLIVLNVRQSNAATLKIYRRLGYRQVGQFIEGTGQRY
jgi:ribosomal protein S18 acetylase RimI-like enzyme